MKEKVPLRRIRAVHSGSTATHDSKSHRPAIGRRPSPGYRDTVSRADLRVRWIQTIGLKGRVELQRQRNNHEQEDDEDDHPHCNTDLSDSATGRGRLLGVRGSPPGLWAVPDRRSEVRLPNLSFLDFRTETKTTVLIGGVVQAVAVAEVEEGAVAGACQL